MTTELRATSVLDRLREDAPRPDRHPTPDPAAHERGARGPAPLGWGSHEERRMMLAALAGFVVLGLYATAFILLGHVLSG